LIVRCFQCVRWIGLAAFAGAAVLASAKAADAPVWRLGARDDAAGERWTGPWRWQGGDNPAWAQPGFDDSTWAIGPSTLVPRAWTQAGGRWPGVGWFRVRLDSGRQTAPRQFVLEMDLAGAAEVFLDGRRILQLGTISLDGRDATTAFRTLAPAIVEFAPGGNHVLAVRYANAQAVALNHVLNEAGGFEVRLVTPDHWLARTLASHGTLRSTLMFFTAIPLLLVVIHLALFLFQPRGRDSLYCALFMGALSLLNFARSQLAAVNSVDRYLLYHQLLLLAILAFALCGLLTVYTTFRRPARHTLLFLATLSLPLLLWTIIAPSRSTYYACAAFGLGTSVEAARVAWLAVRRGHDGARLVFGGMVIFAAALIYNTLLIFEVIDPAWYSTHTLNLGILAVALAMSLFVARNYALTSRQLERELHAVEKLSAENLQKEVEKQAWIVSQKEKLEREVLERTQELRVEKGKSDQLLANILPAEIAAELKEHGASAPRRYEEVTILFSDFKGFTHTTAAMPAHKIVAELNDLFRSFDDIMAREGLEKIKTIGDAYMAAAGLPEARPDHAVRAVKAAQAMLECLRVRNEDAAVKWHIRIGLHSGPVVAGVVGKRKFTFDVFGDTVNLASRMESLSDAGHINVTAYTYDLVKHAFTGTYRGKLEVKGKGELDMYLIGEPRRTG
jgi:class 3 adenylate cyclase